MQIPLIEGAPNIGPYILPSDKPGTDFAATRMINSLQTNLAPKSIIEQLQKPVVATTATGATAAATPSADGGGNAAGGPQSLGARVPAAGDGGTP